MRWPAQIALQSSARLVALIAAIHAVAAIAFAQLAMHMAWTVIFLLAIGLSAFLGIRAELGTSGIALRLEERGKIRLEEADRERLVGLLPASTDFGWAVWLQWQEGAGCGRRGARMLLPDSMAPDDWRTLRIWLRHSGEEAVSDEAREGR